tara:strand:- start:659 stop:1264 length:606 start_codon:yes stop_codon:yes gene_type:complete
MIESIVFYIFAFILIFSGIAVISMRNPVHSVLFLILGFFTTAGLFVMLGAEFIGLILAIVYVGAVAVLFLFVVMMLDINFKDLRKGAMQYVPIGLVIGSVILVEFFLIFQLWQSSTLAEQLVHSPAGLQDNNTKDIGAVLYTDYVLAFQVAGMILLVAMVGAIVLTLRRRAEVLRQNIKTQVTRKREDTVEIRKVTTGTGI